MHSNNRGKSHCLVVSTDRGQSHQNKRSIMHIPTLKDILEQTSNTLEEMLHIPGVNNIFASYLEGSDVNVARKSSMIFKQSIESVESQPKYFEDLLEGRIKNLQILTDIKTKKKTEYIFLYTKRHFSKNSNRCNKSTDMYRFFLLWTTSYGILFFQICI